MIRGSTYQYHIIISWHDIMGALFHRILAGQGRGEALVLDIMHVRYHACDKFVSVIKNWDSNNSI